MMFWTLQALKQCTEIYTKVKLDTFWKTFCCKKRPNSSGIGIREKMGWEKGERVGRKERGRRKKKGVGEGRQDPHPAVHPHVLVKTRRTIKGAP